MKDSEFCCTGCQFVYKMIHDLRLERYYELKTTKTFPLIGLFTKKSDLPWLESEIQKNPGRLLLKIQGVQCAACVWLIQEVAKKVGNASVSVNTALGSISIAYDENRFDIRGFVRRLVDLGYYPSPFENTHTTESNNGLLLRLGICGALSMNIMMFSASIYTGLEKKGDPWIHFLITNINFVLATLVVLIGGSYFIQKSIQGLKNKILHFDLPIALGMLLAYTGSVYAHFFQEGQGVYFDSVAVFVTLMILGRFVQQSVIEKNQNNFIHAQSLLNFHVRKIDNNGLLKDVPVEHVKKGDHIIVPLGSLIPVAGVLMSSHAIEVDTSWVNGEVTPKLIQSGEEIPGGCTLLGPTAAEVQCGSDYEKSQIAQLFIRSELIDVLPKLWHQIAKYYVWIVIALCALGFGLWFAISDISHALSVAISIAVVTCPCSLGLAIPLARTIAHRLLLQEGVFIQKPYVLDHVRTIQNIAFDKTGTITMSQLVWRNVEVVDQMCLDDQKALFNAVSRSYHPASRAIYERMASLQLEVVAMDVREEVGKGLHFKYQGDSYYLGRSLHVKNKEERLEYEVQFYKGENKLKTFQFEEVIQEDMKEVLESLEKKAKHTFMVSGDQSHRVYALAKSLHFKEEHVFSQCTPDQKRSIISNISSSPTMYIGDGLNDQLALDSAKVSALSLHGRLQLSQKADLYFLSFSMKWLSRLFLISDELYSATRFNLRFLVIYNMVTIGLAMAGWITPLLCAVIMPLSSLFVIIVTICKMKKADVNHIDL
ncbi:MAG: heavy metal translocating P-type ATPase metal-binding domain-containing protein [Bdellovibrionales bacterium]|nr:heavy metal translocating P-type ATPase metal-binding domain-containing protein [Bdellovibrionales bacterium]